MSWTGTTAIALLLSLQAASHAQTMNLIPHSTTFFGNSFNGEHDTFVQGDALGLAVLPDGTFYVNSVWDEGFRDVGIYRNGQVIGKFQDTHGWARLGGGAICSDNSRFVFMAMRQRYLKAGEDKRGFPKKSGENWYAIRRFNLAGVPVPFTAPGKAGYQDEYGRDGSMQTVSKDEPGAADGAFVQGLAITNGKLYASDYSGRRLRVYDVQTFQEEPGREFPLQNGRIPFQVAARNSGTSLWVIERQTPYGAAVVSEYALNGKPTGRHIDNLENPSSIAFAPDGRLLIADDGPLQIVDIFDVSPAAPKRVGVVGEPHGMFGTNPGQAGPNRFNGITGAGMDGKGDLIVSCNGAGVDLRPLRDLKIKADPGKVGEHHALLRTFHYDAPSGTFKFVNELHSFIFVDVADVSGNELFTTEDRFSVPAGLPVSGGRLNTTWLGTHLNRFAYPDDPRLHMTFSTAWVRTVQGKQLLYLTSMYPTQGLAVYRFDGEIAVPAAFLYLDPRRGSWPVEQPENGGAWIWTDRNGDGQAQQSEISVSPTIVLDAHTWAWQVDSNGDVWAAPERRKTGDINTIYRLRIDHLDGHGVPVYQNWGSAAAYSLPSSHLDRIERVYYEPASDEMIVTGYQAGDTSSTRDWGFLGTTMLRYQGWDAAYRRKQTPEPVARLNLPYRIPAGKSPDFPKTMDLADGRIFIGYLTSSQIMIYDRERLTPLGRVQPGPDFESSWIDLPYGIRSIERGGSFYILAEENLHGKNIVYKLSSR